MVGAPQLFPAPALLKEVKLLSHLTDAELAELIQLGEARSYEPHANIVIEGEPSWGLFLILDGLVGIFKKNKLTGDVYDVGQLRKNNYFGEMSLVDEHPRSASVRALTRCQLLHISKDAFNQWLSRKPERRGRFIEDCVKTLVVRIRELDENYVISQYQLWQSVLRSKKEAA